MKDNLKVKAGRKIGEGDFSEESNWAGQLAAQEERIKRAFLENQEAERETDNKLGAGDWEEVGDRENTTHSQHQLSLESGVESLSQQIVESLLSTLSGEGQLRQKCIYINPI